MRDALTIAAMYGYVPLGLNLSTSLLRKPRLSFTPRLVNHFKLGADPEFVFSHGGESYPAQQLGLKTGLFAGADQNGRLVEIRPRPSRSALGVLGSLLVSLRWLMLMKPETAHMRWISGAWQFNDGIGGHIHFGRKRPTRAQEIVALDAVARILLSEGVLAADEHARRMQGDRYHQLYGLPSDFRLQVHGYEYRSLPSWLDSPWVAYLCLVASKLAVYQPDVVTGWENLNSSPELLRNLFLMYRDIDDDAAIALAALDTWGMPKHQGGDFKARWGVTSAFAEAANRDISYWPSSIGATKDEIKELFEHLVNGKPLQPTMPVATWKPTKVPVGFKLMTDIVQVQGNVGLGEMCFDFVTWNGLTCKVFQGTGKHTITVSTRLLPHLAPDWRRKAKELAPGVQFKVREDGIYCSIEVTKDLRTARNIQTTRALLLSGLFPVWRVGEIDAAAAKERWGAAPKAKEQPKVSSKCRVLYPAVTPKEEM